MVSFPPCKINLGLNVLSKREDGFHNIETCFYPVPWTDILEIIPGSDLSFGVSGNPISGNEQDNLCMRAYTLLKRDFGIPPVHIHLHKIIPMGAGLGGGSSDAAATLTMLNEIFSLGLDLQSLRDYALQLGSDCPFFIDPQPMLGTGRGEVLTPVSIMLQKKFLILVAPLIHVSTAEAYHGVKPREPKFQLSDILESPIFEWKEKLVNDFETSVFFRHPQLRQIKERLYDFGALYAGMSGSGSSVFGLFDQERDLHDAFAESQVWSNKLP